MANIVYTIKQNGKELENGIPSEIAVLRWFHNHCSTSMDLALRSGGYSVEETDLDTGKVSCWSMDETEEERLEKKTPEPETFDDKGEVLDYVLEWDNLTPSERSELFNTFVDREKMDVPYYDEYTMQCHWNDLFHFYRMRTELMPTSVRGRFEGLCDKHNL